MCGIAGIVSWSRPVDECILAQMNETMLHRGPDHSGNLVNSHDGLSVGLACQRLSIIDLSPAGDQPISNETKDVWIVYNGELYNNAELRRDLEGRGHVYHSRTDTETIVHAYEEFGLDCFERLNGMFALALYDARQGKVILARDRMGVKPLYYWQGEDTIVFASELKTLLMYP